MSSVSRKIILKTLLISFVPRVKLGVLLNHILSCDIWNIKTVYGSEEWHMLIIRYFYQIVLLKVDLNKNVQH